MDKDIDRDMDMVTDSYKDIPVLVETKIQMSNIGYG